MTRAVPPVQLAIRAASGVVGLAAVGLLSGCAAQAAEPGVSVSAAQPAADPSSPASASPSASPSGGSSSSSAASSSGFKDGTFTKTAPYQTPGGTETVTVTVALRAGTISSVKVVGSEHTANAKHYVEAFAGGVGAQVVGKKIAGLQVGAIAGSSLTPNGFNTAVAQIEAAAKA